MYEVGEDWHSSGGLIDFVEREYKIFRDDVAYAYWLLVHEGSLIRGPKGVRRGNGKNTC